MNSNPQFTTVATPQAQTTFMSKVWGYFGLAIMVAALGAWAGEIILSYVPYMAVYVVFMGLMFTQGMWHRSSLMFYVFAFTSGAILYPTLAFAAMTGQISAVIQALVSASGLFFAAALWGYTTKKDLSGWGQFLFFTMIGLFIAGVLNIFLGNGMFQMIISGIAVVLFSAYTSYDIQAIKNGAYDSAVTAAFHLYFNLFAIFNHLLTFFLSSGE